MNANQINAIAAAAQHVADAKALATGGLTPMPNAPASALYRVIGCRVSVVERLRHTRADGTDIKPGDQDCLPYHHWRLHGKAFYLELCQSSGEKPRDFTGYQTARYKTNALVAVVTGNAIAAERDLRGAGYPYADALGPTSVLLAEV